MNPELCPKCNRRDVENCTIDGCAFSVATCPFDRTHHGLAPEDPCPVCGDLGTFDAAEPVSRCVSKGKTVIA